VREVNEIALGLKTAKGENLIGGTSPVTGLDVVTNTSAPNVGTVFTGLPSLYGKHISGTDAHTVVAAMNKATASIKDARVITLMPPAVQGLGAPGGFTLELEDRAGLGPEALAKATNELVAAANKNKAFAGAFTLFNAGAPSMKADIDREKAEKLGLTPTDIFSTIGLYLGSQYVNDFNFYGRTYPVYVQADHQFRSTTANIGDLKVRNAAGMMVPLSAVTTFKSETKPYRVPRYNLYPPPRSSARRRPVWPRARRSGRWRSWPIRRCPPASATNGPIWRTSSRPRPSRRCSSSLPLRSSSSWCWRRSMKAGRSRWPS
jgi:multidrug efflux pump subunit AcrB